MKEIRIVNATSIEDDDMHWSFECPMCNKEYEYEGFFDGGEITECKCGCLIRTERMYFANGSYIN